MSAKLIGRGVKYVLPALVIIFVVVTLIGRAYVAGGAVERAVWVERQADADMKNAMAIVEMEHEHQYHLEEIKNEKKDAVAKLELDVARATDRGLYVRTKACDGASSEADGPDGISSTPGRTRLHEETERNLIALVEEADRVVIQYEACVSELLHHITLIPSNQPGVP